MSLEGPMSLLLKTCADKALHCIALLLISLTLASLASAGTYYVSTSGSDSNPGTQSAPFRHVSKAALTATQAGDTVIVMDGTYDNEGVVAPNFVVTLYYSGTSGNPITFKAQNPGKAILSGFDEHLDHDEL